MRILYLGIDLPENISQSNVVHCPLISIVPRPLADVEVIAAFSCFSIYTHLIFTSKSAARICLKYAAEYGISKEEIAKKHIIAVGRKTAEVLGICVQTIAQEETAEGIVKELDQLDLKRAHLFWPHSALSRSLISDWIHSRRISFTHLVLYNTISNVPDSIPNLDDFDEIIFTSPSTVDAFLAIYGILPVHLTLTAIGPHTKARLMSSEAHYRC